MDKNTKNIIIIAIILIMIICSYFTVKQFNTKSIPDISFNQKEMINDKNDIKEIPETTEESDTTKNNDNKKSSDKNSRPNRPSGNSNFELSRVKTNRSNTLVYIILFGLESCIIGGSFVYLILLNTNKLKENNKKEK